MIILNSMWDLSLSIDIAQEQTKATHQGPGRKGQRPLSVENHPLNILTAGVYVCDV